MRHLGDITKISGYEAPVVDVVIGGSPCQDLSAAGKRAGLAGERSGLYMEQIRIIKEMRDKDARHGRSGNLVRPRYMVWENVPGAFSSNGGKDFAAVIEEAIRVAEPEAPPVPVPEKGWPTSGVYADEQGRWSVAWRVLDSQFWGCTYYNDDGTVRKAGTPQRRRRIALVADFGGLSAPEVLFVRDGVFGDHPQSECERQEAAGDAGASASGAGAAYGWPLGFRPENVRCYEEKATTLCNGTRPGFTTGVIQPVAYGIGSYHSNAWKSDNPYSGVYEAATAKTLDALNCGYPACNQGGMAVVECSFANDNRPVGVMASSAVNAEFTDGSISPSLLARAGTGGNQLPLVAIEEVRPMGFDAYQHHGWRENDKCGTLTAGQNDGVRGDTPLIVEPTVCGVDCRNATEYPEINSTLQSDAAHNLNSNNVVRVNHIVRRLTPLECERLQGFPDGWTDIGEWVDSKGKKHKDADSPRYKALGNSIAIPPWKWVCKRLCACYERDATMASLFDGIGGFPYIWEQLNGKGSCLWASEIEEFPIAVTKLRFGGE